MNGVSDSLKVVGLRSSIITESILLEALLQKKGNRPASRNASAYPMGNLLTECQWQSTG